MERRVASTCLGALDNDAAITGASDDNSFDSDSTGAPPSLVDASGTSGDDNSDDSAGWGSLFLGDTDLSPDGPGPGGQPFSHYSHRSPTFISLGAGPPRTAGATGRRSAAPRVVWIDGETPSMQILPQFAMEREGRFEAAVKRLAQLDIQDGLPVWGGSDVLW